MFSEKQKSKAMHALRIFNKTDEVQPVSYISDDGKFLEISEHDDVAVFLKDSHIIEDTSLSGDLMLSLGFIKSSLCTKYIFLPLTKVTSEQLNAVEKVILECQDKCYDSDFFIYTLNPKGNTFNLHTIDLSDPNASNIIRNGIRRLNTQGSFSIFDKNHPEFEI